MKQTNLKALTVYLLPEEFSQVAQEAADHGVTISAYVRARLGFKVRRQGAPVGNRNRVKRPTDKEEFDHR